MKISRFLVKYHRKLIITFAAGASLTQLGFAGCNSVTRDTLLAGIEQSLLGLVGTFINAFFTALQSSGGSTSQPVVQAVVDFLPKLA